MTPVMKSHGVRRVIIDADACPQKARLICNDLTAHWGWAVFTVASFQHHIQGLNHIVVGNESQAVDCAILNLCTGADVVVTQDWGLAAMVMGKGAQALSPTGVIFERGKMDFLLEERHVKAKVRRGGGRTKGPRARCKDDDVRFARALEAILRGPSVPDK